MIYFLQASIDGPIKIGRAKDAKKRVLSLQVSHYEKLSTLLSVDVGSVEKDIEIERGLHRRYALFRIKGEWYSPVPALLNDIEQLSRMVEFAKEKLKLSGKKSGINYDLLKAYASSKRSEKSGFCDKCGGRLCP